MPATKDVHRTLKTMQVLLSHVDEVDQPEVHRLVCEIYFDHLVIVCVDAERNDQTKILETNVPDLRQEFDNLADRLRRDVLRRPSDTDLRGIPRETQWVIA